MKATRLQHFVERYSNGRKKPPSTQLERTPPDRGSSRTAAKRAIWNAACFKGGGQGKDQSGDLIGLLWLCGYLDSEEAESGEMLKLARDFWASRTATFGQSRSKAGKLEAVPRTTGHNSPPSKAERRWESRYKPLLPGLGADYTALVDIMEEDKPWAHRLAAHCLVYLGGFDDLAGFKAADSDFAQMAMAKRALVVLHGGSGIRRAA